MSFAKTNIVTKPSSGPTSKWGKRKLGLWGKGRFKRGMKFASGRRAGNRNRVKIFQGPGLVIRVL